MRKWLFLPLGVLLLLFGLILAAGSLNARDITAGKLDDPFFGCFVVLVFYFLPAVLISSGLKAAGSHTRLRSAGIVAITLFGFVTFAAGTGMKAYNHFVQSDENVTQAFNDVEIAYQKRFNVIKNMNAASNKYQQHERSTIQDIVEARKSVVGATNGDGKIAALNKFDAAVKTLILNIEQYPNLKADHVVRELMREIIANENDILARKTEFNARVTAYNKSVRMMPYGLVARMFHFRPKTLVDKEAGSEIYDAQKLLR